MINKVRIAAILLLLRFHPSAGAATLKPETKAAWDAYLQAANAAMQARLQLGAHFLWHCHIAVEKSDVGVVAAVTGQNDSGASWLSGS
jgi:hypothetical protein